MFQEVNVLLFLTLMSIFLIILNALTIKQLKKSQNKLKEMKESKEFVQTVRVTLHCTECNNLNREMKPTGICLTSNPPQYPHKCESCGYVENVRGKTYPCLEYRGLGYIEGQEV